MEERSFKFASRCSEMKLLERWFTYFGTDKEQTEDTNFVWENMNMGAIVDEARKEICEAIQQHI